MGHISNNDIAQAIYLSSKDKTGHALSENSKDVLNFLVRRRLISKSDDILTRLQNILNKEKGIMIAKITSAQKLSGEVKKDIAHFLKKNYSAQEIFLEEYTDEHVLNGVKIEINNEVIDLTLKNKIGQLKEYLIKAI